MKLLDGVPWQADIVDAPPIKLGYGDIEVPPDLDLTYVGTRHDIDGGEPDYAGDLFAEADVFVCEVTGWTKQLARSVQEVSNGSYTALKARLEEIQYEILEPGFVEWHRLLYRQLYESGVRVVFPDYPRDNPNHNKIIRTLRSGKSDEEAYQLFADRDRFIMMALCDKIAELRRAVPDMKAKKPLRALMLFGVAHHAVHDALSAAATEQGVTSFSSRLLFDEGAAYDTHEAGSQENLDRTKKRIIGYQNWLRAPEN